MSTERELTNDELDAVSGGTPAAVEYRPQKAVGGDGVYPPTITPDPVGVWKDLLHQYGY